MQLPANRTPGQDAALVECLRVFAARGRALRLQEQAERQAKENRPAGERGDSQNVIAQDVYPDALQV